MVGDPSGIEAKHCRVGRGLFATRKFRSGQRIAIVRGRVVRNPSPDREEFYMDYGSGGVLEPAAPFRYLNHSCEPNVELQLYEFERARPRLELVALRDIDAGEELRNDYGWPADDPTPCFCGTQTCRGWIVDASEVAKVGRDRLNMEFFPDEFSELLNAAGQRMLGELPRDSDRTSPGDVISISNLMTTRVCRDVARLLNAKFENVVRRRFVPAAPTQSAAAGATGGPLDLHTAELNTRRSRAGQVAWSSGLVAMLSSESFRGFAERCSGRTLLPNPGLRIDCYRAGQSVGPVNVVASELENGGGSSVEVQLSFCEGPVRDQLLVCADDDGLSDPIHLARSGLVNVLHRPLWYYVTPLEVGRPAARARRWVIAATFSIA